MRDVSADTRQLIEDASTGGGFNRQWLIDLMYDGERRLANVPVTDVKPQWDASAFVIGSGSMRIVWNDDHARSLIPREIGDWFAPFGAEVQLDCMVGAGVFAERVSMGRFVVESVPNAVEASLLFEGRLVHPGESFTVNVKDALVKVARDEFPFPTRPSSESVWEEIQAITGLPVVRSVPDATIPASMAYADKPSDVLSKLFDMLGAWPHPTGSGAITARPKVWPDPVDEIRGVVSAPISMTAERTYNRVVVEGKAPNGDPIYAVAEVTDGFLRVRNRDGSPSPFGTVTYRYSSEFITTYEQALAYARELLPRVARIRSVTREVVEPFNPLREVGDVLTFRGGLVRVQQISHDGGTTRLVVEVPDE